jgi:hypothetical protein
MWEASHDSVSSKLMVNIAKKLLDSPNANTPNNKNSTNVNQTVVLKCHIYIRKIRFFGFGLSSGI